MYPAFPIADQALLETAYRLECVGAKNATCLSRAQIQAVKKINRGPRNSKGQKIAAPAGAVAEVTNIVQGFAWDGAAGWRLPGFR